MGIEYEKKLARLLDVVSVEDAEGLLEWLQSKPHARLNLAACTHLHTANLQVLMAARPHIVAWPANAELAHWLRGALAPQAEHTTLQGR
jgi:hypothetical protein